MGWLIETLQPVSEQGNSSEVSQVLFNTSLKFNALDDYSLRVVPGQIINLCTLSNAHPFCLFPHLYFPEHVPFFTHLQLKLETSQGAQDFKSKHSGQKFWISHQPHVSNTSQVFVPAPTVLGISTLLSCNTSKENCLYGCARIPPGLEGSRAVFCGVGCWSGVSDKSSATPGQSPTSSVQLHCRHNLHLHTLIPERTCNLLLRLIPPRKKISS